MVIGSVITFCVNVVSVIYKLSVFCPVISSTILLINSLEKEGFKMTEKCPLLHAISLGY